MKKKTIMYIGIIFLILIIILIGYLVYINHHNNNTQIIEYTPEAEITDEQLRQTIVTLYFMNKGGSGIIPKPPCILSYALCQIKHEHRSYA